MDIQNERIIKIIKSYEQKREREKQYYQEVKKNDPEFIKKNRERARNHYAENKDKRKEKYENNKELNRIKSLYRYYKKKDKEEEFKEKHADKYTILLNSTVIN
tara:strand:+ start:1936 stop:2244 length:309 start_codon:yes stop_codon:yes gene_type:complete